MNEQDYEHKMEINQIIRIVMANKKPSEIEGILYYQDQIIEIADLIRADEREACAEVCDARYMGDNNREDMEAKRCAEAIRARGNK
jgi:hypothetical protein